MTIYKTRQQAIEAMNKSYADYVIETQCVNVIRIGPMVAKFKGCKEGWAIDREFE